MDLVPLDALPRTGWVLRGVASPESIAGHILGTAHLAIALGPQSDPPLDMGRVLGMALLHDAPEARTGDLPQPASRDLPPGAKQAMEDSIAEQLLADLGPSALELWHEYRGNRTRESRFVRLCDKLQLGVRLVGYVETGAGKPLGEFVDGLLALDATEFPAAEELRLEILDSVSHLRP